MESGKKFLGKNIIHFLLKKNHMLKPSDVTIIIPHLGADEQQEYAMEQCIHSLNETVPQIHKVIAKNTNHCKDQHIIPNCSILRYSEQGQNKAVNAAVATTNTPWIFITNDDMVYAPGWFEKLTTGFSEGIDKLLCFSPMLIEPRPGAPTFGVYFCGGAGGDFDKQKWLDFVKDFGTSGKGLRKGFNLPFLIKRELWDLIGGYDINYDPWGSNGDSDLEYKIKLAGVQPYQNTNCLVYHFSQTSGTFNPANDSYRFRNYAYFREKWGFDRTDDGIWEATFKIPTKEEGRVFNPIWEGKYEN